MAILTGNLELRAKVAETLNVVPQTVYKYMKENEENGLLTTHAVVDVIAAETGLTEDQILIEESQKATA